MLSKPDEEDLWSDILNDVSTASTNRDKKCLLVLGDEFVGKTAVISRLRRLEGHTTKAGLGLEYSYLDIRVCTLSLYLIHRRVSALVYVSSY
jgi:hypothetical protein